jgi:hypothetical protein
MRLSFPDAQHAEVRIDPGSLVVGSGAESDVRLDSGELRPQHVAIDLHPQRGLSLRVLDPGARVFVNGRPVREFAFLRAGDCIALGSLRAEVVGEVRGAESASGAPDAIEIGSNPSASRVVLRGVSGRYFGRSIAVADAPVLGSSAECQVRLEDAGLAPRQAQFGLGSAGVTLYNLAQEDGARVNGHAVTQALLGHGDQIAFDQHRFVLEAPGLPGPSARTESAGVGSVTSVQRAVDVPPDAGDAAPRSSGQNIWWLIAAAALIGLGFVFLLMH